MTVSENSSNSTHQKFSCIKFFNAALSKSGQTCSSAAKWLQEHPATSLAASSLTLLAGLSLTNTCGFNDQVQDLYSRLFTQLPPEEMIPEADPGLLSFINSENFSWAIGQAGEGFSRAWDGITSVCTLENVSWSAEKVGEGIMAFFKGVKAVNKAGNTVVSYLPSAPIMAGITLGLWVYFHPKKNNPVNVPAFLQPLRNTFYPNFGKMR